MQYYNTHTFLDSKFSSHVKLTGAQGTVKLADSTGSTPCKFGVMTFIVAGCKCTHTVGVMDLNPSFDMIIGDDWMNKHKAVLNYDNGDDPTKDKRCIQFGEPSTQTVHVAKLATHQRQHALNSVIYNTIADIRQKVKSGANDADPNPVTHMFTVHVSKTIESYLNDKLGCTPPPAMCHAMQHEMTLPHTQQGFDDYDQADSC